MAKAQEVRDDSESTIDVDELSALAEDTDALYTLACLHEKGYHPWEEIKYEKFK